MNPLSPVTDIVKAVTFPIQAIFIVGLCYFINAFTSSHHWWAHWVLFGMTIATLCVWMRALKTIIATVGIVGAGYLVHRWWKRRSGGATIVG